MAIAYRSSGTLVTGTLTGSTSANVGLPTGYQANDILLCCFNIGQFSGSGCNFPSSVPSGWNLLGTATTPATVGSAVYYKVATGSEGTSQTWSGFSIPGIASWYYHFMTMAFTGGDTITPIKALEWNKTTSTSTAAAQSHPSITPTVAGSGVVLFRTQYQSSGTARNFTSNITSAGAPAGVERSDPAGSHVAQWAIYSRNGGFSLAAQSFSTTASGTGNGGQHMWTIVLAAEAVAGPSVSDSVGVLQA